MKVGKEAPKQAKAKFWRVVVAATTLGDTLVELKLFEWTLFEKMSLTPLEVLFNSYLILASH